MIYKEQFFQYIKNELGLLRFNATKTELFTYCPFCEGRTGKKHGHLYISCSEPLFYCQRCSKSGHVNELLAYLESNFNLKDILNENSFDKLKQDFIKFDDFKTKEETFDYRKYNEDVLEKETSKLKIDYVSDRLNIDYNSVLDIPNIVLDIEPFYNRLSLKYDMNFLECLNETYVGFLCFIGNKIVLRKAIETDYNKDFKKYYSLSFDVCTTFDVYLIQDRKKDTDDVKIIVAEGVFDILYPYYNDVISKKYKNITINYWISVLGRSFYRKALFYSVFLTKCTSLKVFILSDKDTLPDFYEDLKSLLNLKSVDILYCKNSNDFGNKLISNDELYSVKLK